MWFCCAKSELDVNVGEETATDPTAQEPTAQFVVAWGIEDCVVDGF